MSSRRFRLAICGMGSAGSGLLLAAANYGVLDELLASGVVGIEQSPLAKLRSNLANFQIAANSYGGAFLEILADPAGTRVLTGVEDTAETHCLTGTANTYPPLEDIGAFMTLVLRRAAAMLAESPGCELRGSTAVTAVAVSDDGVEVTTDDGITYQTLNATLTMGGIESRDLESGIVTRIRDLGLASRLYRGSEIISDFSMLDDARHVAIFGGSHSAWAVAVGLLVRKPTRLVAIVERHWPAIYYPSRRDADLDEYVYDPENDVCPLSGRVNRLGGLRGPARDLALRVRAGRLPNVHVVNNQNRWEEEALFRQGVLPADALITALGYRPRLPALTYNGRPLELGYTGAGLAVGSTGIVRDVNGDVVPGLYAFGLGAGLASSGEVGGEKSYRGRLDGVWLYQHTVGKAVLRSMGIL